MSIATITNTTYNSPNSFSTFVSMLNTAMGVAGFTTYDSQVLSGIQTQIYSINLNSSASKGINYLQTSITSALSISTKLLSGWTVGANTPANAGTSNTATAFSLTSLVAINFYAISSAELKGVLITQGTLSFLLGIIRPANLDTWYNENTWNYAFLCDIQATQNSNQILMYRSSLVPEANSNGCPTNWTPALNSPNPFNGNQRQIKPIEFYTSGNCGVFAYTSTDLVWCASASVAGTGTDTFVTPNATYLYLGRSTSTTPCQLAVRIA